jgi:hypothetical protein
MSLSNELRIEMIPKESGSNTYRFIKGMNWRMLIVSKAEIERFFSSKGIIVSKWDIDSSWNEITETNDLYITLNKFEPGAIDEFKSLFIQELNAKSDQIDREYGIFNDRNIIIIQPQEEKVGVDFK